MCISAKTGEGTRELLERLAEILGSGYRRAVFHIPYSEGALVRLLHDEAVVKSVSYDENGTVVDAIVKAELYGRLADYAGGETRTEEDT